MDSFLSFLKTTKARTTPIIVPIIEPYTTPIAISSITTPKVVPRLVPNAVPSAILSVWIFVHINGLMYQYSSTGEASLSPQRITIRLLTIAALRSSSRLTMFFFSELLERHFYHTYCTLNNFMSSQLLWQSLVAVLTWHLRFLEHRLNTQYGPLRTSMPAIFKRSWISFSKCFAHFVYARTKRDVFLMTFVCKIVVWIHTSQVFCTAASV